MPLVKVTILPVPTFLSENTPVALNVTVSPANIPISALSIPFTSTVAVVTESYTLSDAVIPVTETGFCSIVKTPSLEKETAYPGLIVPPLAFIEYVPTSAFTNVPSLSEVLKVG